MTKLRGIEKTQHHDEQPANLTCGDIDILKPWLEVLMPLSLE
jgi:hypothetical protein